MKVKKLIGILLLGSSVAYLLGDYIGNKAIGNGKEIIIKNIEPEEMKEEPSNED